jgi:hypothetical protein
LRKRVEKSREKERATDLCGALGDPGADHGGEADDGADNGHGGRCDDGNLNRKLVPRLEEKRENL